MKTPVGGWGSLEPRILQDPIGRPGRDFLVWVPPDSKRLACYRAVPFVVFRSVLDHLASGLFEFLCQF